METTKKVNHIKEYYQNNDKNFAGFFNEPSESSLEEIKKSLSKVNKITKQLQEAQTELTEKYADRYRGRFIEVETPILLKYRGRNRDEIYFSTPDGTKVTPDMYDTTPEIISLSYKSGEINILSGFCFNLASVIIKKYKYSIASDNKKCTLTLIDEYLVGFLDDKCISLTEGDILKDVSKDNYYSYYNSNKIEGLLYGNPGNEFINKLYGVDVKLNMTLGVLRQHQKTNASFERILKTAPDLLLETLIERSFLEDKPIHQLIGISKPIYDEAISVGLIDIVYKIRAYITDTATFNKTDTEWLNEIRKCEQYQTDLDFYNISYGGWYGNGENRGRLIYTLANFYKNNVEISRNYSFSKFAKYVVEECANQGYQDVSRFMVELRDYIRMSENHNSKPSLYTSYLKLSHDILSRNCNIKITSQDVDKFLERYKEFRTIKFGEYGFYAPASPDDLKKEGNALNHCVASYIKKVIDGKSLIYFLRKNREESLITIEVQGNIISQARGASNRMPDKEEIEALEKFGKKFNLKLAYM